MHNPHVSNANLGAKMAHTMRWRRSAATKAVLISTPTERNRLNPIENLVSEATNDSDVIITRFPPSNAGVSRRRIIALEAAGRITHASMSPDQVSIASRIPMTKKLNFLKPVKADAKCSPSNVRLCPPA